MKLWVILLIFLLGLGLGLSLPSIAPKYLGSYFPKIMKPSTQQVKGTVVRKQADPDRLLLTISSEQGAILATFKKTISEISLLVDEGDTITFAVKHYAPFVSDPPILRVEKPQAVPPEAPRLGDTTPSDSKPSTKSESLTEPDASTIPESLDSQPSSP